jgi:hypothetical protein
MFQREREEWANKLANWRKISDKEKTSNDPRDILRVQLLTGQAEAAYLSLMEYFKSQGSSRAYFTISAKDSCDFHLGHYLVVCNSLLLFERFKEYGGFDWSTPQLPIHLAMTLPDRQHWVPILAPLSGENLNGWSVHGFNLAQWAIVYHCSLSPLIKYNMWPNNKSFEELLRLAEREDFASASLLLKVLCEKQ